jgi:hypothetical protein
LLLLLLLSGSILLVVLVISNVVLVTTIRSVRVGAIVLGRILSSIVCGAATSGGGLGSWTGRGTWRLAAAIVATVIATSVSTTATATLITITAATATTVTVVSAIATLRGVRLMLLVSDRDILNKILTEFLGTFDLGRVGTSNVQVHRLVTLLASRVLDEARVPALYLNTAAG